MTINTGRQSSFFVKHYLIQDVVSVFFTYPFLCVIVTPRFYSIIPSLKFSTRGKFLNRVFLHCECALTHCFYCNIFSSMIHQPGKMLSGFFTNRCSLQLVQILCGSNYTKIIDKYSAPPSWHDCCTTIYS